MGMGSIIKDLINKKGMTIKELSEKTGIPVNTLYSITKRDSNNVRMDNIGKIADVLGVTVDYLIGWDEEKTISENLHNSPVAVRETANIISTKLGVSNSKNINLNVKDKRDIAIEIEKTLKRLEYQSDGLMFNGEALDEETKELLKMSLEHAIITAKIAAKKKYTPKKYRKDDE